LALHQNVVEEADLVLRDGGQTSSAFTERCSVLPGVVESLTWSGFCVLIVGAGIGLDRPGTLAIRGAIRERRALMGMVEFAV
jgi:hypothetical protein